MDINIEAKVKLDKLLKLEPAALTPADVAFLRARCSYIPIKKQVVYKSVLTGKAPREKVVKADATDILPEGEHPSYRDLQRRAAELGARVVGKTRDELNQIIAGREPK